jgi:tRNA-dihydrouridine synthase
MIGRAAIGNPWIFQGSDRGQVTPEMVREVMLSHLARNLDFYGEERGLILFRKHAVRYLSPYPLPNQIRRQLLTAEQPDQFIEILNQIQLENAAKSAALPKEE